MHRVQKYSFPVQDLVILNLPQQAEILRIDCLGGEPVLWALVDSDVDVEYRSFQVYGTGQTVAPIRSREDWAGILDDDVHLKYIATFQHGIYTWHVFERITNPEGSHGHDPVPQELA